MLHLRTFPCPSCTSSIVAHLGSSTLWTILALRDTKWSLARMHTMRMIRLAPPFPLRAGTSITAFSYCPSWPTSPVRSLAHRTSSCLETSSTVLSPHEPSWVSPRAPVYSNTPPRSDDLNHQSAPETSRVLPCSNTPPRSDDTHHLGALTD